MSDLRTLHDAFAELDRRADAATAGTAADMAPVVRPRRTVRLVLGASGPPPRPRPRTPPPPPTRLAGGRDGTPHGGP